MSEFTKNPDGTIFWDGKSYGDFSVTLPDYTGVHKDNIPKNELNISAINTVRHFELPAKYNDNHGETHPEYELIYVEKGVFLDVSEPEHLEMHAGDAVLFKPFYFHNTICDGQHSASIFIVAFQCQSKLIEDFFGDNGRIHIKISAEQRRVLAAAFAAGVKAYNTNSHFCELKDRPYLINRQIFINYLEILILQIISTQKAKLKDERVFFEHDKKYSQFTNDVIACLQEKLYSNVTIDELCQQLGYSRGHICSHFKNDTGRSIINYYQSLKIEEAKRLILETGQDFSNIAEVLGYSNSQYFNKVFRKFTGHTPGYFRKTIFKGSLEKDD